jgi:hypothetical protein
MIYTLWPFELNAPTIQIAWQRTDLARWNAPATSTPTTSIAAPSSVPSINPSPSGLSTGAKAGIGVGATAVGLLVIAAIVFFVWRRRRRARDVDQNVHHDATPGTKQAGASNAGQRNSEMTGLREYQSPPQAYQSPSPAYQSPLQGYHSPPQEHHDPQKPEVYRHTAELPDPAELESGWRGWEAPTTQHAGTSSGDEIHPQSAVDIQAPTAVQPISLRD